MIFRALIALLFVQLSASAQRFTIQGKVLADAQRPVSAIVQFSIADTVFKTTVPDKTGAFLLEINFPAAYTLTISAPGFATFTKEIKITYRDSNINIGTIRMQPIMQTLAEVKIVTQALAVAQKDDTVEYSSGAYKVNPNADAADLVRKMPGLELDGKDIKAQGENVVKVLVDGKPFFGDDPWATLKNLPADVIQKVQVYNEKTDQERFTGFREGATSKTINIVTKPDKRKGLFGNVFVGGGADNSEQGIYGAGITLNRFDGDRRVTLTSQANNVNIQNFTEQGVAAGGGGSGITTTRAGGINYSDKWGKKTDISGSYFYNTTGNDVNREMRRTYVLPNAAGQVYEEQSPSATDNTSHRLNMRLTYTPDTMNTLLLTPTLSLNEGRNSTLREGSTAIGTQPLNSTRSRNEGSREGLSVSGNMLYTHRFRKKGRTFSAGATGGYNKNDATNLQYASNIYYTDTSLSNTLDQQVDQWQHAQNTSGNITWTEPVGKSGIVKGQYDASYAPSESEKNAYNNTGGWYTQPDSLLSGSFASSNTAHKAGISYQYRQKKYEVSGGLNYQATVLHNEQRVPAGPTFNRAFYNVLPVASFQYRLSKTRNVQGNYSTRTTVPSVTQLQDVVNNTDPLHLTTGNPALRQPYTHSLSVRYNASGGKAQNNFSASLSGAYIQDNIASTSIIAMSDTIVRGIQLPAGAQLVMPVNIDGSRNVNGNMSYSLPIKAIKCRLNINLNAGMNRSPAIVNGVTNYQQNRNAGGGVSLNSNISENVDFRVSSNTTVTANSNPVNPQLNSTYISQACRVTIDLILWKGIVVNSSAAYQANFGLSAGYNRNYLLWNMALGKKLFRKRQGDIRLSVFDVLNQNNNIQRSTTESYIQDMQTNILQRYFMLVFTYKISSFGK